MRHRGIPDLSGQSFGRLTVVRYLKCYAGHAYWYCRCQCGRCIPVVATDLRRGHTQSCGCLSRDLARERGKQLGKQYGRQGALARWRKYYVWKD